MVEIDNTNAFDPNQDPIPERIPVPDNDPHFITDLHIAAEAGGDPGLAIIKAKHFDAVVEFMNGRIGAEAFIAADQKMHDDSKAYNKHKALHDQK